MKYCSGYGGFREGTVSILKKPTKVTAQNWGAHIEPFVSIVCITYKHADFYKTIFQRRLTAIYIRSLFKRIRKKLSR